MNKFIINRVKQNIISLAVLGLLFFSISGKIEIVGYWIYVSTALIYQIVSLLIIVPRYPEYIELAQVRKVQRPDAKRWDKALIIIMMGANFLTYILGALDVGRFQVSLLPFWCVLLGIILYISGSGLNQWAMVHNTHFEREVRIQTERMHQVVESGPYRYVRHPGYFGSVLGMISFPLIVGSGIAIIGALFSITGMVFRTYMEDKILQQELTGYEEYAEKVRWHLIPYVW